MICISISIFPRFLSLTNNLSSIKLHVTLYTNYAQARVLSTGTHMYQLHCGLQFSPKKN